MTFATIARRPRVNRNINININVSDKVLAFHEILQKISKLSTLDIQGTQDVARTDDTNARTFVHRFMNRQQNAILFQQRYPYLANFTPAGVQKVFVAIYLKFQYFADSSLFITDSYSNYWCNKKYLDKTKMQAWLRTHFPTLDDSELTKNVDDVFLTSDGMVHFGELKFLKANSIYKDIKINLADFQKGTLSYDPSKFYVHSGYFWQD